jgi:hypothetical protein
MMNRMCWYGCPAQLNRLLLATTPVMGWLF